MSDRLPSSIPELGEMGVRDWHPDEGPEKNPHNDFTRAQVDSIQSYINQIAELLGLGEWDIFLTWESSKDTSNASIHPTYGAHSAGLAVNKNWWSFSPEEQRNIIVHELLHVIHNRQTEVIRTAPTSVWMWRTFERETEMMVDHIANHISKYFPLPERIDGN